MNVKKGIGIAALDAALIAGGVSLFGSSNNTTTNVLPTPTNSPINHKFYVNTPVRKDTQFTVVVNPAPSRSSTSSATPSAYPSSTPSPIVTVTPTQSQTSSSPSPRTTITITPIQPVPYPTINGVSCASPTSCPTGTPTPTGSRTPTPTPTGTRTPSPRPSRIPEKEGSRD